LRPGESVVADVPLETVDKDPRLSQLSTQWSMLTDAYDVSTAEFDRALQFQTLRYLGAVHRYFLKTVRDPDVVQDLNQEFATRFLAGSFLKYDPKLGRFRDYIKRAVRNLMLDFHRRRGKARQIESKWERSIVDETADAADETFIEAWRSEILDRAWTALEDLQRRTRVPYHTILKHRAMHPSQTSEQMAKQLGTVLGQPLSPGALRQRLQHARERWVGFMIDEVKTSLGTSKRSAVEEELGDLRLLHLCKPVMNRLKLDLEDG
jgi:RNA polymerase sigma factor (sigma-70 family)